MITQLSASSTSTRYSASRASKGGNSLLTFSVWGSAVLTLLSGHLA